MQVTGNKDCVYLYLTAKNFLEKFFNANNALKHVLCEKLEMQDKFHEDLEAKKTTFQFRNAKTS